MTLLRTVTLQFSRIQIFLCIIHVLSSVEYFSSFTILWYFVPHSYQIHYPVPSRHTYTNSKPHFCTCINTLIWVAPLLPSLPPSLPSFLHPSHTLIQTLPFPTHAGVLFAPSYKYCDIPLWCNNTAEFECDQLDMLYVSIDVAYGQYRNVSGMLTLFRITSIWLFFYSFSVLFYC